MYDKFLSPQWVFDRCVEAEALYLPLTFLLTLVFAFLFYLLIRKSKFILHPKIIGYFLIYLIILPVVFYVVLLVGSIFGHGVVGCSDWKQFYPAVNAAHKIHATMKQNYIDGHGWPENLDELEMIDSQLFDVITENSKVNYVYDSYTDSYTWFVRPSRYFVVILDKGGEFGFYRLSPFMRHFFKLALYPPSYDGPWDQLPK